MFSKRSSLWFILVFSLLSGIGCSRFLNEKKDNRQALEADGGEFACLQKFPNQLAQFIEGTIEPNEVRFGLDCGKAALVAFSKDTKSSTADGYIPEDLRGFVGKYFLKQDNITPGLVIELFKLKKMLLGGAASVLTKAEIQKITEMMEHLKEPLVLLAPHMPRLTTKAPAATLEELETSSAQLTHVLLSLVDEAELLTAQYSFPDFKNLLLELNGFLKGKVIFKAYKVMHDHTGLIEAVKNIFIGEIAHFEGLADWQRAVKTLMGLHLEYLRYHYVIANPQRLTPVESLRAKTLMIDDGFKLLAQSLPMSQKGLIPFRDLDGFVEQLALKELLPLGLTATSVKNLYKTAILRALDSKRRGDARDLDSLERSHFMALHHEWRIFKMHQMILEKLNFDRADSVDYEDLKTLAENDGPIRNIIQKLSKESLEQQRLWTAWTEGRKFLLQDYPAMYDREGRAIVMLDPLKPRQTRSSLTRWNVVRGLARLMMLGYGQNKPAELLKDIILVEGLEQWYADFQAVGIELKAFDPRSVNSGARSFKEANFFTFKGDGNSQMNYQETFDFVSLLVSGGMVSSEGIRQAMLKQGCGEDVLDVYQYPFLTESCFKQNLRSLIPTYFSNLPGLVSQSQKMTAEEFDELYENLMAASRTSDPAEGRIETGDVRTAVMILHYTESLLVVYDKDRNGRLNAAELKQAAPRFQEFMTESSPAFVKKISQLFPGAGHDLVEDFFLYLVYRGQKPTAPFWDYIAVFQAQKKRGSLGEVSRDKILRVFKVLKDEASRP